MPSGGPKRTRKDLNLNGTHQLLAYADVNILGRKKIPYRKERNSIRH
jgi:hypothetical protein